MKPIDTIRSEEAADWDINAEFYERDDASPLMLNLARRRDQFYEVEPGKRVLDLGCGSGATVARLRERGIDAVGVDYSAAMVGVARREFGLGDHVKRADATDLPFPDNSFDVVLANGVLHHLAVQKELASALREVSRVLKPGGKLCCFDRNGSAISALMTGFCIRLKELLRIITRRGRFASCASRNEIPFGSRRDLKNIEACGFVLSRRKDVSALPFHLAVITLNTVQYFVSERLRRSVERKLSRTLSWFDSVCGWHWFCVEQFVVFESYKEKTRPFSDLFPGLRGSKEVYLSKPVRTGDTGEPDAVGL